MKHVFLFQVHRDPELLDRILKRLTSDDHYFVVNVDAKSDYSGFENVLSQTPNVVLVTRYNIMHGGFSQISCTIKQFEACTQMGLFDYYHTISGQDYPCVSNEVFDKWFEDHAGRSYSMMDTLELVTEWRKEKYLKRLECWNFSDIFNHPIAIKLHLNGIAKRLFSGISRPYPDMDHIWGCWNWFSLSDKVVRYLLTSFAEDPAYVKRFKYTYCCDELIFSTKLYDKRDELDIETFNSLRYVEWYPKRPCSGLPLVLDEREFVDIIHSGAFFCRKVTPEVSAKLLDLLDERSAAMSYHDIEEQHPKHPMLKTDN